MKSYINETDSIHYVYGNDTKSVLHTMAYRFIGDNPPMPFILRAFHENGVTRRRDGAVVLDFQRLFPEAHPGDWGAAIGDMWCPEGKNSSFLVSCESETLVCLNGEPACLCPCAGSYAFSALLQGGMNRFLIVTRKEEGFCCTLNHKMPQWEPCSFLMPFVERGGEAGFNFTLFKADEVKAETAADFFLREQFWGKAEKDTEKCWLPDADIPGAPWEKEGQTWFAWTEVRAVSCTDLNRMRKELVEYLRSQKEKNPCVREVMINGCRIDEADKYEKGMAGKCRIDEADKCEEGMAGKCRIDEADKYEKGMADEHRIDAVSKRGTAAADQVRSSSKKKQDCQKMHGSVFEISWLFRTEHELFQDPLSGWENNQWECHMPVDVKGNCGKVLFLGPLDCSAEEKLRGWLPDREEFLTKPFQLSDKAVFWKTIYPGVVIRPFAESRLFGRWTYPLGVTLYGMLQTGLYYENEELTKYVHDSVEAVVMADRYAAYDRERYGFPGINQQLLWLDALDDCGSFGSCMLEYLLSCPGEKNRYFKEEIHRIAGRICRYILKEQIRNQDGAFKRRDDSMWIDDMYMSVPFLVRYAEAFRDSDALQEAAGQLLLYKKYFYLKPGVLNGKGHILSHMYKLEFDHANLIPWSRGNGWVVFSLSELLVRKNPEIPMREELVSYFQELCEGYLELQDEDGLWHQILDEKDSYQETSAAAMFICAMSRGIRYRLLPEERLGYFIQSVFRAWDGLTQKAIDRMGNLYGVCQGSGWSYEREYYRTLSWNFNDTHGTGIVMLAGVETDMLKQYLGYERRGGNYV